MSDFHFLRPLWFLILFPLLALLWRSFHNEGSASVWNGICDDHLLPYLIQTKSNGRRWLSQLLLLLTALMMTLSLAGPSWERLPVPTYQKIEPRVVVLDMSNAMQFNDLTPDRLTRAKFKLHDLFLHPGGGQYGLVVYTDEPFVVSPLTDDAKTIDALLSSLTIDVMPVQGQNLSKALLEAKTLITDAGFSEGQLLVMTANVPSNDAISTAKALASKGIRTSIVPIVGKETTPSHSFKELSEAGQGLFLPLSTTLKDIDKWLALGPITSNYKENQQSDMPVFRDEGRWFLIPALCFLLPMFRRGWLS